MTDAVQFSGIRFAANAARAGAPTVFAVRHSVAHHTSP